MAAAKEAFPAWSRRSPEQRAEVLNKLADLIQDNLEDLAQAESKDQGAWLRSHWPVIGPMTGAVAQSVAVLHV